MVDEDHRDYRSLVELLQSVLNVRSVERDEAMRECVVALPLEASTMVSSTSSENSEHVVIMPGEEISLVDVRHGTSKAFVEFQRESVRGVRYLTPFHDICEKVNSISYGMSIGDSLMGQFKIKTGREVGEISAEERRAQAARKAAAEAQAMEMKQKAAEWLAAQDEKRRQEEEQKEVQKAFEALAYEGTGEF